VLLIVLLVTGIRAQNQCSCACCLGQTCAPIIVGTVSVQNCSAEMCLAQCRCQYYQCGATSPSYGQVLSQCLTTPVTLYSCQCLCCNAGNIQCTPTFVGLASAYLCQPSACSIACFSQYPAQCLSNQYAQTVGTCVGPVTTTTAMTTVAPWLGYLCSCLYCPSGYTCSSNTLLGVTSVSQCSSSDCTEACQSRYPYTCTTAYLSQVSGVCLTQGIGRIRCKCNCCGSSGCIDYELTTNDTCTSCYSRCQQVSPCVNSRPVTYSCTNNSIIITNFSLSVLILILIIVLSFF
jgi:hypothetical protein